MKQTTPKKRHTQSKFLKIVGCIRNCLAYFLLNLHKETCEYLRFLLRNSRFTEKVFVKKSNDFTDLKLIYYPEISKKKKKIFLCN